MAKRKAAAVRKASKKRPSARPNRRRRVAKRLVKRQKARPLAKRAARVKKTPRKAAPVRRKSVPRPAKVVTDRVPRLERTRRILEETVPTPPSSLDMRRQGSAARTGRAEIAESLRDHRGMSAVTAGDVDVNTEDAYFTGEEAPGGDNPTPDQDIVDDIGKALGLQYDDNEELKGADKVEQRDKHRWELDPASSDDYKDRK